MASTAVNPHLRMNQLLRDDQPVFGIFQTMKGVRTSQIMCNAGLDAIIVDCEHGNIGDSDMHDCVAIIAAMGVAPIVRVRGDTAPLIKRALDTGAHGVMVPLVSTAEDAKRVVSMCKFPPFGIRGQGSPYAPFAQGLKAPYDYVNQYNANTMIIAQIETAQAIENIDEIAGVDGLDMLFIGPNDLALSMLGYVPAKGTEQVYHDAIEKVVAAAKKKGKKVGILVNDGATAKKVIGKFDFIVIGNDAKLFGMLLASHVAAAKA